MENQEILITVAIILVLAYFYWQNQQKSLTIQPVENDAEISELRNQVSYYQKLYQSRVEKDLEAQTLLNGRTIPELQQANKDWEIRFNDLENLTNQQAIEAQGKERELKEHHQSYQQKVNDLETSLFTLAKQKIKGKKDAESLVKQLESNWKEDKEVWQKEKQNLEKANDKFNQSLLNKGQKLSELQSNLLTLQSKNNEFQQEIRQLQQENQELKQALADKPSLTQKQEMQLINLSNYTKFLTLTDCPYSPLDVNDFGSWDQLTSLTLTNNSVQELTIIPRNLTNLEFNYPQLVKLTITENGQLQTLNILAGRYWNSEQKNLKTVLVNNQKLVSYSFRYITNLEHLNLADNQLTSLGLKDNSNLISLNVSNNKLQFLDITRNEKLIPEPSNFYQQEGIKLKLRVQENQIANWGEYDKDKLELEVLTKEEVERERERESPTQTFINKRQ